MSTVENYNPAWRDWFSALRRRIEPVLGGLDARIEHVGSTAVRGLGAKPIIDIDVVVATIEDVPAAIARLESVGYRHVGDLGIAGREAFESPDNDGPLHFLYVVVDGTPAYLDHVEFRDWLRTHPADAARYEQRKREVAHLLTVDRKAYVDAKAALIREILEEARRTARP
jgi:GrpB-like predicted nucleotidyltransferase (UPF0157 family)